MKKIAVLGAGPSGLSAAWQIGSLTKAKIDLYEKSHKIGGVCGCYDFDGLRLDYGAHKIYSVLPGIMDVFRDLGKERLKEVKKSHKIVVRGRMLDYPVRLGEILSLFSLSELVVFCFSIIKTMLKAPFLKEAVSYEDYCINVFGRKAYEVVFRPLAEKVWGDPRSLSADIARTRIPTKSIYDLILRMLGCKKESKLTNADTMLYPFSGFYDICECVAEKITAEGHGLHLGKRAVKFVRDGNRIKSIVFNDGAEEEVDLVISSMPLKELTGLLFPEDKDLISRENFIRMRHSTVCYLLVNKPVVMNDHWVFCADKDILFSRISEQKLFSDKGFPEDKTVISCDFTCDEDDPIWKAKEEGIARQCIKGLEKLSILTADDVIDHRIARVPNFYPVCEISYRKKIEALFEKINQVENIICTGRLGLCSYSNIDHCFDMSIFLARELAQGKGAAYINNELLKKSRSYRIID
ncbi:MAG: NAD(P)-binding protein [Candidatus Omnitrophica bacterium]|nr:NAD(P)-binding protein [Candidatus Omnitrophota bacterium]